MQIFCPEHRWKWIGWLALACFSWVVFLGKGYETSLPPNDSALHAGFALGTTNQGHKPNLPMASVEVDGVKRGGFNDHPFTFFYINGKVMRLLGSSAWSARVLPAAFGVGTVLLTGWIGTLLHSHLLGFFAAILTLLTPGIIRGGASFHLDIQMMFFILLSFVFWIRNRPIASGVSAGLGMWIKTPVALLIVPVALLESLFQRLLRPKLPKLVALGLAAGIVGASIWILTGLLGGWDIVKDYWVRQLFGTAVGGRGSARPPDLFLFFKYITKDRDFIPWIILVIPSVFFIVKNKDWKRRSILLPLLSIFVLVAAISPMRFKYAYYFLPTFPFLHLINAHLFERWFKRWDDGPYIVFASISLLVMAFLLCSPVSLSPEGFPALKRFNAIIQHYGACNDQVVFVPGYQPYGGMLDYSIEITFYTGRDTIEASCENINTVSQGDRVGWIMISGDHYKTCISNDTRKRFPTQFQWGNQYLLSNRIPETNVFDLTPLERELQGVIDCQSRHLPQDRYRRYQ